MATRRTLSPLFLLLSVAHLAAASPSYTTAAARRRLVPRRVDPLRSTRTALPRPTKLKAMPSSASQAVEAALSAPGVQSASEALLAAEKALPEPARETLLTLDKIVLPEQVAAGFSADSLLEADLATGALAVGLLYLTARPGVLEGAFDAYVKAPLARLQEQKYSKALQDIAVGNQLGSGGYGTVYRGSAGGSSSANGRKTAKSTRKDVLDVVVKKVRMTEEFAREAGDVELYMNRRVMRAAPDTIPKFLGTLKTGTEGSNREQRWLVWEFSGDDTLQDVMASRNFPLNLEERLFGSRLKNKDPEEKEQLIVKKLAYQLLRCLSKLHDIGVCHRDIKPENILVTEGGEVRLIDFGASVDLRNGYNYKNNFTLLDPGYAAPETYVMPEDTPDPPPATVAALLSPFLWVLNKPDRFDVYSAGLVILQMLLPRMRNRSGLREFNNAMKSQDYNINEVKNSGRGGLGWEQLDKTAFSLVSSMVCDKSKRISADAALRHPWFLTDLTNVVV